MAKAVQELPSDIKERTIIIQWDMRTLEGNRRARELNASCLPSIAIDDDLIFESIIPTEDELITAIAGQWSMKNRSEAQ